MIPTIKHVLLGLTLSTMMIPDAFADTAAFKAALTAQEEVPANDSKGTGVLAATYDTTTKILSWKVSYLGLTGPATAAHFHGPALPGKNAGVEVALPAITSPVEGKATLTEAQEKDLMAGQMYINIHTAAHPNGEIRGQVTAAK